MSQRPNSLIPAFLFFLVFPLVCFGGEPAREEISIATREIALQVSEGVPLRIALAEKTPIRKGQEVRGELVHPIYVFDREVVPAGTAVLGRVSRVDKPTGTERAKTYMSGRLRLNKEALVEFDTLVLEGGRRIPLETSVTQGTPAMIRLSAATDGSEGKKEEGGGAIKSARSKVRNAVKNNEVVRAFASTRSEDDASRKKTGERIKKAAGGKWRGVKNALLAYWPFGGQSLRPGTQFTAILGEPLDFGTAQLEAGKLARLGSPPAPDALVEARLLETISSETAQLGSVVRAVITRPLHSEEGHLVLPQGALLEGDVTQVKPARRFGRDGKLRFRFSKIEMPSGLTQPVSGSLAAAEVDRRSRMKLDAEGGAKVSPSKKRFIAPAAAVALTMTAVPDGDDGAPPETTVQGSAPGWSGFGIVGSAVALAAPATAGPLGVWGAANSVFFNLIRKADELEFPKNTLLEIRFGRTPGETEMPATEPAPASQLEEQEKNEQRSLRTRPL